jgi:hypothetical protein
VLRMIALFTALLILLTCEPAFAAVPMVARMRSSVHVGFVDGLIDRSCNRGSGFGFTTKLNLPAISVAVLSEGTTIVSVAADFPASRTITLYGLTRSCTRDRDFGRGGVARIRLPGTAQGIGGIGPIAPGINGQLLVAGSAGTSRRGQATWVHFGLAEVVREKRQGVLNAAYSSMPHRFRLPPQAPRIPTVAWINRLEDTELELKAI